ncbi:uncharacterized protein N7483_010520 [Penicillium malachiteum]|uniref:uncharacterized protein n=1 Tax=Penicillium malachiteum TaxID=1324776 RepID=UPI002548F0B6|nr:uncharacterized protein N7483_010520 [Penicillium malachiteum]KAJ5713339.1 hypothetical protein N7483_010520 [Penicillium malachiteum]
METASSVLEEANGSSCTKGPSCPLWPAYQARAPFEHFHVSTTFAVYLYRKSDTLWELDAFGVGESEQSSDILSAPDPQLPSHVLGHGSGRMLPQFSHIRIPSPARYCEDLLLLLCRDTNTRFETYWMAMLTYIKEYVDEKSILKVEDLQEEYRKFYCALRDGDLTMFSLLDELCRDLSLSGRLPGGS